MAIFKQTFEPKLIYVYRINDEAHKGILKVGEASYGGDDYLTLPPNSKQLNDAAKERIRHQTQTAGINFELLYTERTATYKNREFKVFQDHEVHECLTRSGIKKKIFDTEHKANEWFYTDLETVKKAIAAVKEGRKSLNANEISTDKSPVQLRPEQSEAIERTVKYYKKKNSSNKFLWNAKMRFGKTLSALQVIKKMRFKRTIILTHRPVVDESWFEDYHKIFYDEPHWTYTSKNKGDDFDKVESMSISSDLNYIYFASIQDMRGSELVGGKFAKNEDVFNIDWDFIIIDEAHEGTQTELGKKVLEACRSPHTKELHLSGTPFNLLDDFSEEQTFTWDYVMEQKAKAAWDIIHQGDPNPYACLPRLNIFTYNLGELYPDYADADIAFNFREFFRTNENGEFIHVANVKQFLDLLCKKDTDSHYPYSTEEYRANFRHSLWIIPGVREARALSKMLQAHPVFGQFRIANVAGDGDEEEESKEALKKVENAIGSHPEETYSITLSCGRLTTGVSVKPWTACLMLAGSYNTAASSYMQTIFRVQTPAIIGGKQKTECFVFDFAPDRTLKVIAETAKISRKAGETSQNDRAIIGEFLNFCPIIGFDGSRMQNYDTEKMLGALKRAYVERVVRNGFEDGYLYNNELMKLDSIALQEFDELKKIIGTTKAMAKTGDIDINTLGFTDEEYEQLCGNKSQKDKRMLSPEEQAMREKLAEAKKNRDAAVSILRGISIRMPLMIYGAELKTRHSKSSRHSEQNRHSERSEESHRCFAAAQHDKEFTQHDERLTQYDEESVCLTEKQDSTNAKGYIYIVTNKNKTTLYIGVTNDLKRRINEHKNHIVEGFTDKYNCEYLVYFECFSNITEAIEREKYLKGKKHEFKENLINSINPKWIDLYNYLYGDVSATPQHDKRITQHDEYSEQNRHSERSEESHRCFAAAQHDKEFSQHDKRITQHNEEFTQYDEEYDEEPITIDNFADIIDDQSWKEFMPQGVTKERFKQFQKYYDADIFRESGIRIREMTKAADKLSIEERIERIANIFNTFRNPDKETVLTPWRVVNMHLTDCLGGWRFYDIDYKEPIQNPVLVEQPDISSEVYKKNTHILEINSKSGLYALYMAYSIYRMRLKQEFGIRTTREQEHLVWNEVLQDNIFLICKTPMAKSIAKRTLAGFTGAKVHAHYFEDLVNQLRNKPETFIEKVTKMNYWIKDGNGDMKFDAIVGNPPYQEATEGTSDIPVYNYFYDVAFQLSDIVSLITPARYLFNAGKTPKEWNEKMLNDEHLKVVKYWANSNDVFPPPVDIKGGVAITLHDKNRKFGKIITYTAFSELNDILQKVINKKDFKSIDSIIYTQNKFDLNALYSDYPEYKKIIGSDGREKRLTTPIFEQLSAFTETPTDNCFEILGLIKNVRYKRYILKKYIESHPLLEKYKVLLPASNGSGAIGEVLSTPLVGEPLVGYTQSFIGIGNFNNKEDAENCLKYIKSKFARAMLGILKVTQHNHIDVWKFVPLQDFTAASDIDWSKSIKEIDQQLYKKYGLSDEEVAFIESKVKEM